MKTYTLTIYQPEGDIAARIATNPNFPSPAKGQFVLWDGPALKADLLKMVEIVRPYCRGLSLVCGKGEVQRSIISEGSWE